MMEAARRIPAAVIAALAVQAIAGLIWAGAAAARISALEERVGEQRQVSERLARLEEQSLALRATLDRIEWQLEAR
jgi:Tfp pilus assembly protein PilO